MSKIILLIAGCLALAGSGWSQEAVITNFPVGVGRSIGPEFFRPYQAQLRTIADTLHHYPAARAIVTGGADGLEYHEHNDALNPGLALGRAHALRNLLVAEFGVDSSQIIIQSQDVKEIGDSFRFVSVRIVRGQPDLTGRVEALENRPLVEKHFTETREVPSTFIENCGLRLNAGLSSSPFGAIPIVGGSVTWKRIIFFEGTFGYTLWDRTYRYMGADLDTRRRLAGGMVAVFPCPRLPVGAVGGWVRIEEISQRYYDYVRLSEGPMFGLRATPIDLLSVTAVYNPSKHRVAGSALSQSKNSQFLISIMVHKTFGGGK